MSEKLTILGILALLAAMPASASTFLQFAQNGGTPTPLIIADVLAAGTTAANYIPGGTDISLASAPILWNIPNTLGTGARAALLTFDTYTSQYAAGNLAGNTLSETGFWGSASIFDVATNSVWLSWTFGPTGTLTVANNGHTGTFVDSAPLSKAVFNSNYLSSAVTSQTFQFTLYAASNAWKSDGYPILLPSAGLCTNCRLAPNTVSIWSLDDTAAPEPATMAMLGSALIGLGLLGRKRFLR